MALMAGRVKRASAWAKERRKHRFPDMPNGRLVMFPSTHDLSPHYLEPAIRALHGLLDRNNQVVLVTKAHLVCVKRLCLEFAGAKERILWRFTIGSLDCRLCRLWEPGAPLPNERLKCLKHAYQAGFRTSVSMEPLLAGREDALKTFRAVAAFASEDVWIGKMNHVERRVNKSEPSVRRACATITAQQSNGELLALVADLTGHPKVRWKDSIRALISRDPADGALGQNN
jgi:DNA repair photolyase